VREKPQERRSRSGWSRREIIELKGWPGGRFGEGEAGRDCALDIDACPGKRPQVFVPQVRVGDVEPLSPASSPSPMKDRSTLCSSSILLKNAQM
jgi:hypothetical protein